MENKNGDIEIFCEHCLLEIENHPIKYGDHIYQFDSCYGITIIYPD